MKPRGVSQGVTIWFVWAIVFALNGDDVRTQQIPRPPFDANEQPLSDTKYSVGGQQVQVDLSSSSGLRVTSGHD
ncbi:hypothetical protein DAPPUDRAFT_232106 [Daphnia pulex]|uniref:Uncharacterized protein n=1 Tax=Daphnia pulex TaxID=6669 RepID=E9FRX5_DAPPU|nr:hypothetical protein DAPPUDRAFT_232106 [Daphnia pulex]|eukprot:EFX89925.1 hypothetical protein DAPPUDRAFT_232106 [Daphnia pulex]